MNTKKKKLFITSVFTFIFSLGAIFISSSKKVFANENLINKYQEMDSIMHISDGWLWNDLLRGLGWGIVEMLVWLNNFFESVVTKVIVLNDFYSSPMMTEFMNIAKPLVFGLFVIAVFVLGFQFMLNKIEKPNEVVLNVLLSVAIIVVIPILMTEMNKVVGFGLGWMQQANSSLADGVVKSNVADIKYYAENNFATAGSSNNYVGNESTPPRPVDRGSSNVGTTELKYANQLPTSNTDLWVIEKLDMDDSDLGDWKNSLTDFSQEMLENRSVPTGTGGSSVVELRDNQVPLTDLGKETYYRYHVNWGVLFASLLVTSFALVITVIKIGRAIFDLAFHQIFGMFVAVSDLTGGQRTKKILAEIANTFAVIFIMVFILRLFILYANWANSLTPNIGSVGVVLLLIAGAWAVIDAPDIVQRLMGIDAGLRSGYQAMMGAYAGVGLASKLGKGTKSLASSIATKGAGAANFGSKMAQGMAKGANGKTPTKQMPNQNFNSKGSINHSGIANFQGQSGNNQGVGSHQQNTQSTQQQGMQSNQGSDGNPYLAAGLENNNPDNPVNQTTSDGQQDIKRGKIPNNPDQNQTLKKRVQGTKNQQNLENTNGTGKHNNQGNVLNNKAGQQQEIKRGAIPNNPNTVPSSNKGVNRSTNQQGIKNNITDKGYTQTNSGIYVPGSIGDSIEHKQSSIPSQEFSTPASSGSSIGSGSKDRDFSSNVSYQDNNQPFIAHIERHRGNGWVSGSNGAMRFKDEVTRAGNSGFTVGKGIRTAGSVTGKGMMNTTRAIVHPKKSMDYAGAKMHTSKSNLIRKGTDTLSTGKESVKKVINEIKTPLGEKPISNNRKQMEDKE